MLVQSRLLFATGAVLAGAASLAAYHDGDAWSALPVLVAAALLAVAACLPPAQLTGAGGAPWLAAEGRVQRALLIFAMVTLTVGGVVDAVQGDPQMILIVAAAAASSLASWRAASARGERDTEVDGASDLPPEQRSVHQRDENAVE